MRKKFIGLMVLMLLFAFTIGMINPEKSKAAENGTVRVLLNVSGATSYDLYVNGSYSVDGYGTLNTGNHNISVSGNGVAINGRYVNSRVELKRNNGYITARVYDGDWKQSYTRNYLGNFVFSKSGSGLRLVNHIDLESYLIGVVPFEMSNSFPLEALKAQAVAARTYAYKKMKSNPNGDYHVLDYTQDQVYRGYVTGNDRCLSAIDSTKNQVLLYGGNPIEAYFGSTNGGYTDEPDYVWAGGSKRGYLLRKEDTYDKDKITAMSNESERFDYVLPTSNASGRMNSKLYNAIRNSLPNSNVTINSFKNAYIHQSYKAPGGFNYLHWRHLDGATMVVEVNVTSGSSNYNTTGYVNLKNLRDSGTISNQKEIYTTVFYNGDFYLRKARSAHGLGMSQRGAQQRADSNIGYSDILSFYYPNAKLTTVDFINNSIQDEISKAPASVTISGKARAGYNGATLKAFGHSGPDITIPNGTEVDYYHAYFDGINHAVFYNGNTYSCSVNNLIITYPDKYLYVTDRNVPFYENPYTSSKIIGKPEVNYNMTLIYLDETNDFYKAKDQKNIIYYIEKSKAKLMDSLTVVSPSDTPSAKTISGKVVVGYNNAILKAYGHSGENILVENGTQLTYTHAYFNGTEHIVDYNNKKYTMPAKNSVIIQPKEYVYVTRNDAIFFEKAEINSKIVAKSDVNNNTTLEYLDEINNFYKVKDASGIISYIPVKNAELIKQYSNLDLSNIPPFITISGKGIIKESGAVLTPYYHNGAALNLEEGTEIDYFHAYFNGKDHAIIYSGKAYTVPISKVAIVGPKKYVYIENANAPLYEQANISSKMIARTEINCNVTMEYLGESGDFYKIRDYHNSEAYIPKAVSIVKNYEPYIRNTYTLNGKLVVGYNGATLKSFGHSGQDVKLNESTTLDYYQAYFDSVNHAVIYQEKAYKVHKDEVLISNPDKYLLISNKDTKFYEEASTSSYVMARPEQNINMTVEYLAESGNFYKARDKKGSEFFVAKTDAELLTAEKYAPRMVTTPGKMFVGYSGATLKAYCHNGPDVKLNEGIELEYFHAFFDGVNHAVFYNGKTYTVNKDSMIMSAPNKSLLVTKNDVKFLDQPSTSGVMIARPEIANMTLEYLGESGNYYKAKARYGSEFYVAKTDAELLTAEKYAPRMVTTPGKMFVGYSGATLKAYCHNGADVKLNEGIELEYFHAFFDGVNHAVFYNGKTYTVNKDSMIMSSPNKSLLVTKNDVKFLDQPSTSGVMIARPEIANMTLEYLGESGNYYKAKARYGSEFYVAKTDAELLTAEKYAPRMVTTPGKMFVGYSGATLKAYCHNGADVKLNEGIELEYFHAFFDGVNHAVFYNGKTYTVNKDSMIMSSPNKSLLVTKNDVKFLDQPSTSGVMIARPEIANMTLEYLGESGNYYKAKARYGSEFYVAKTDAELLTAEKYAPRMVTTPGKMFVGYSGATLKAYCHNGADVKLNEGIELEYFHAFFDGVNHAVFYNGKTYTVNKDSMIMSSPNKSLLVTKNDVKFLDQPSTSGVMIARPEIANMTLEYLGESGNYYKAKARYGSEFYVAKTDAELLTAEKYAPRMVTTPGKMFVGYSGATLKAYCHNGADVKLNEGIELEYFHAFFDGVNHAVFYNGKTYTVNKDSMIMSSPNKSLLVTKNDVKFLDQPSTSGVMIARPEIANMTLEYLGESGNYYKAKARYGSEFYVAKTDAELLTAEKYAPRAVTLSGKLVANYGGAILRAYGHNKGDYKVGEGEVLEYYNAYIDGTNHAVYFQGNTYKVSKDEVVIVLPEKYLIIKNKNTKFYNEASTSSEVIAKPDNEFNMTIEFISEVNNFYKAKDKNGLIFYVAKSDVELPEKSKEYGIVFVNGTGINVELKAGVRSGPGKDFEILGYASKDARLEVTSWNAGSSDGHEWVEVVLNNKKGYMTSESIKKVNWNK